MEGCGEQQLTTIQTHQLSPELASKSSISVAYDSSGQSPLSHYLGKAGFCYRLCICGYQEDIPALLALLATIYYSCNKLPISFCKIYVQHLHWLPRHFNVQRKALGYPGVYLPPIASITLFDVL